MPANEEVGNLAVKVSMDSTGFQNGISGINRELKIVQSEFKAASAGLGGFGNSTDQLKLKADGLSKQIEIQKQRVEALSQSFQASADKKGMDVKATQDLQVKLNLAKAALSNMEAELKKTNNSMEYFDRSTTNAAKAAATLKEKVGESLSTGLRGVATSLASVGAAVGGAFAGIYKLAESASNLNEAQNVVQQTFKTSSDAVIQWTGTVSESAGIGKTAATSMVGAMGAMLKSSGLTEQAAGTMSEKLVQLSGDLASFYNLKNDDAWEKIRAGIAGETKPLKDLGINMDVANLSAFALSQGIQKHFDKMSQGEQTTLRYNYLLSVTKDAQGDFTRTSDGMANQSRLTTMEMGNLKTSLGLIVMPSVNEFLKGLNESLKTIDLTKIKDALAWIMNNATNLISGALGIGAAMVTWNVASMINGVVKAIKEYRAMTEGATIAQAAFNVVLDANPIGLAITAIVGLSVGLVALWKTNEGFRNAVIGAWDGIKAKALELWTGITITFNNIKTSISETGTAITTSVAGAWEGLKSTISNGLTAILSFIQPALTFWQTIFQNAWDIIKNIVLGAVLIVLDIVTLNFTQLGSDLENIWNNIKTALTNILNAIKDVALNAFNTMRTEVINLCNAIKTSIINIWNGVLAWLRELPGQLQAIGSDMFTFMKNGVMSTIPNVKDAIVNGITVAIEWIKELPGQAVQWGKDIIMGIVNGIKSAASAVGDAVKGVAQDIRSFLHFSVPDQGPLVDFESWMPDFMSGLAAGIERNKGLVKNALGGLTADMSLGIKQINVTAQNVPKAQGTNPGVINQYSFAPGSIVIPAKDLAEMRKIQDFFDRFPQVARAMGVL